MTEPESSITTLRLHELTGPNDEAACFWLDVLQRQFPLYEQVSAGSFLHTLQELGRGELPNSHLLTAHSPETDAPLGMAWYDVCPELEAATLWYLALAPGQEGQGTGSLLLSQIVARIFNETPARLIVLELEREDSVHAPVSVEEETARRKQIAKRNRFYSQRFGALMLSGIHYIQSVGWQDAVRMDLCVLFSPAFPPLSAEETFTRLKALFQENLQQEGALALAPYMETSTAKI